MMQPLTSKLKLSAVFVSVLGALVGCSDGPAINQESNSGPVAQEPIENPNVFIPKEFKTASQQPDSPKLLSDAASFLVYSSPSAVGSSELMAQVKGIEQRASLEKSACQQGGSQGEVLCEISGNFDSYGRARFLISYIKTEQGWSIVGIDHQPI